ncbi:MAG: ABC transporter permease [Gammaproteobacteria bacterium]|nr:MAG: ABC transporter permease [Gammaproteobacteria bacterium]
MNRSRRDRRARWTAWVTAHLQAAVSSLGQLVRAPLSTLITSAVIGITLCLPAALYFALEDLSRALSGLDREQSVSLYLRREVTLEQARALAGHLQTQPGVGSVSLIDADTALEQFRRQSGYDQALALLEENPLPHVLVVTPLQRLDPSGIEALQKRLAGLPEVELAQYDLLWIQRLDAILAVARRATTLVSALLAIAVLVIVGNTIRVAIDQRRDEIVIGKLFGATDAFMRRPFLYAGAGYGLFAGVIACILLGLGELLLQGPVTRVSGLYQSGFRLGWIDPGNLLSLLLSGLLLGLIGAWFTVVRRLREIEPQ